MAVEFIVEAAENRLDQSSDYFEDEDPASNFVKGYFEHSRLHFLSGSKAQLRELVREGQARAESNLERKEKENLEPDSPDKGKGRA
ncbi:hypothetical protein B0H14DRAFT_3877139 [Mycena olivaceomarginata]|nr:hypothetical protein B0H14DRAFT_3877139 [Mycena olivaceomarginata]